jgi:hypothetical protein
MGFDWTKEDAVEAPRLPIGQDIEVEITRIVLANKDGPFMSQSGDPKILVVMADDEGREASAMLTLSEKAGWVLRSILSAAGVDMARLKADKVEPSRFADEEFGKANLIGRRLKIRVKQYVDEAKGNMAEITALRARPKPISTDDIPI